MMEHDFRGEENLINTHGKQAAKSYEAGSGLGDGVVEPRKQTSIGDGDPIFKTFPLLMRHTHRLQQALHFPCVGN